ncbi:WAT1-related protein At4g08290-like isoform X2 [Arachis stenosperma]|uniref:WAT1-related protein At4g08290-like isoform X2 n=1 Tax=Arachis stenosperma TaxID=217475 RepID=UPI0025ABEEDC|nr:WAT1-related protein At4g08290-like isoform X2 [Arachis stenosperma]
MSSENKVCVIMSKAKPYLLMIGLQFGMAGNYIFGKDILNHGMNRFVFIVYRNAMAAAALAPFAFIFERKSRPKMTLAIFLRIMVLGFLEMEHVKLKEVRSEAKVIGTLVTFGGAVLMGIYKGHGFNLFHSRTQQHHGGGGDPSSSHNHHQIAGALYIFMGCVALSSFYILQSITLKKYPAELSLATLICVAGTGQATVVALVAEHHSQAWALGWDYRLYAPLYTGLVSSAIAYYVQGMVMKMRGPVFTTAFNPLCMIIVAALGSLFLGERLYLGSIIGSIIITMGLYLVVWGKAKDHREETINLKSPPITVTNENNYPSNEHKLDESNIK